VEVRTERVYATDADAMQTAGNFISILIELTSCMEDGHDHFQGALFLLGVDTGGDPPAVVIYAYGVIFENSDDNIFAIPCEGFIDRVIHDFVDQVVETFYTDVPDVHGGALANSFQSLQDLDTIGTVSIILGG